MRVKDGFILRKVGNTSVLVPTGSRVMDFHSLVVLNETGTCAWGLLDGKHSVEDVAAEIANQFTVDMDQARRDAVEFLEKLAHLGIMDDAGPAQ